MSQRDNHLIVMWAAKGGSGTTVTAAAAAIHETNHVLLVDLDGDLAAVLGVATRPIGVKSWLAADVSSHYLSEFIDPLNATTSILQAGLTETGHIPPHPQRLAELAEWLKDQPGIVIVDAGTGTPPAQIAAAADNRVLVTRACYLALTKAARSPIKADEIVLVNEAHRTLSCRDIEHALGAPVVTTIDVHPAIARSVDAGLLAGGHTLLATTTLTSLTSRNRHHARSPEIDYGMNWRTPNSVDVWRASYDPDARILRAVNRRSEHSIIVGRYDTVADVDRALTGWPEHHNDPDGLGWLHNAAARTAEVEHDVAALMAPPALELPDMGGPSL